MVDQWQYLMLGASNVGFAIGPDEQGKLVVAMTTDCDSSQAPWLAPNLRLGVTMTPDEARLIGQTLLDKAREAEGG